MFSTNLSIVCTAGIAILVSACASSDTPAPRSAMPAGPSVISGPGGGGGSGNFGGAPVIAGPAGCAGPIGEFQELIDRDAETGSLNPGVYNRVTTDLGNVKQACAAGREAEARSQLAAVKGRYGYR
jgi:hypothetical protein